MMSALNPDSHQGYIANSHSSVVTAFDTRSLEFLGFVKTGTAPDPLAFMP